VTHAEAKVATATMNNPAWWVGGAPTLTRDLLHERLIDEARAAAPDVEQQHRAIVLAGPPGAGKSTVLADVLEEHRGKYLVIDADEFKRSLLRKAQADGSYDQWLMPDAIREREAQGAGRRARASTRWSWHRSFTRNRPTSRRACGRMRLPRATTSSGRYIIGDAVGPFGPGQLFLVGSNLTHDWISDLQPGERIDDRDVVQQFDPGWFDRLTEVIPELGDITPLLARAGRGIEFRGETAQLATAVLEGIGAESGIAAMTEFLRLLTLLSRAPSSDHRTLSSRPVDIELGSDPSDVVASALDYIFANLDSDSRLSVAAGIAGMSESAFSRYFKTASGQTLQRNGQATAADPGLSPPGTHRYHGRSDRPLRRLFQFVQFQSSLPR
jgi:AraC-like DNA-binding protein